MRVRRASRSLLTARKVLSTCTNSVTRWCATPASPSLNGGDLVQTGSSFQDWVDYFGAIEPDRRIATPHHGRGKSRIPRRQYRASLAAVLQNKCGRESLHCGARARAGDHHELLFREDDPTLVERQLPYYAGTCETSGLEGRCFPPPPRSVSVSSILLSLRRRSGSSFRRNTFLSLKPSVSISCSTDTPTSTSARSGTGSTTLRPARPVEKWESAERATLTRCTPSSTFRTMTHFELDAHNLRGVTFDQGRNQVDQMILNK